MALRAKMMLTEEAGPSLADDDEADLLRPFSLASNFFVCQKQCKDGAVLRCIDENFTRHLCLRPSGPGDVWDFDCLVFNADASRAVAACIEAMGLDPRVSTAAQMDTQNQRFYCRDCPLGPTLPRSWRNAVSRERLFPEVHYLFTTRSFLASFVGTTCHRPLQDSGMGLPLGRRHGEDRSVGECEQTRSGTTIPMQPLCHVHRHPRRRPRPYQDTVNRFLIRSDTTAAWHSACLPELDCAAITRT